MSGAFYVNPEFTAPWALELPPMDDCLMFHVMVEGGCSLEAGGQSRSLHAGDFALVPHGDGHVLRGSANARVSKLFDLPHEYAGSHFTHLRVGGGGVTTHLICGVVRSDVPGARHVLRMLPGIVTVSAAQGPELRRRSNRR